MNAKEGAEKLIEEMRAHVYPPSKDSVDKTAKSMSIILVSRLIEENKSVLDMLGVHGNGNGRTMIPVIGRIEFLSSILKILER